MRYQIAFFDPGPESWCHYRKDFKIVQFDSLEQAEAVASELSRGRHGEVMVITIHSVFRTDTEYPQPEPIHKTRRVTIPE